MAAPRHTRWRPRSAPPGHGLFPAITNSPPSTLAGPFQGQCSCRLSGLLISSVEPEIVTDSIPTSPSPTSKTRRTSRNRMQDKQARASWQFQPLNPSPGRPYSPYPYRDLPKLPSIWGTRPFQPEPTPVTTQPPRHAVSRGDFNKFHLFLYLPAELRLQIWRQAMLSACQHRRLHRVRLAVTSSSAGTLISLLPTPHLSASTYSTRALLAVCSEARQECLPFLPDTLPLLLSVRTASGGKEQGEADEGVLRCDFARDILALENLSPELLLQLADLQQRHGHHHRYPSLFNPVQHLGLDLTQLLALPEADEACEGGPAVSPAVETALVSLLRGFRKLQGVYLLSGGKAVTVGEGGDGGRRVGSNNILQVEPAAPGVLPSSPAAAAFLPQRDHVFVGVDHETTEWFTTRPFVSYCIGDGSRYYARLRRAMRLLCQLKVAMGAPAVVPDLYGEWLARLEGDKLRLLWQYVVGGKVDGAEAGELELSSPERCLEIALGRQPRWLQWEFVCQCLDC